MRATGKRFVIGVVGLSLVAAPVAVAGRNSSGVRGRVLAGPTCPVERPGDPTCAPRPVAAVVTVSTLRGRVVRMIRSDADGHFAITLPPAAYLLKARAPVGIRPIGGSVRIRVRPGRTTRVVLMLDTGIR